MAHQVRPTAAGHLQEASLNSLRRELDRLRAGWRRDGLPTRQALQEQMATLARWKATHAINGLWSPAPLLLTATIDDGLGQGLAMIEPVAAAAGLRVERLGLLSAPTAIVAACHTRRPALLGLTVLQLDSEEALTAIAAQLPRATAVIAGGPAFSHDPALAARSGVRWVARDLAHFLDLLLDGIGATFQAAQSASMNP